MLASGKTRSLSRAKAFLFCALAYLLALDVAVLIAYALGGRHPIWIALFADIAATLVIYAFSRVFRNSSFYDAYWSLAPIAIGVYWILMASPNVLFVRQVTVITLVVIWGLRLTYNWAVDWQGLEHEDWRYSELRLKTGRWFWLVDLVGIEMMPTVLVFLGCLSLYPALSTGTRLWGPLDLIAIVITLGAIVIEATADEQLRKFRRSKQGTGEIMSTGLWAYSRHPNYFGEVTFWWGLYLFALAADRSYWWAVAGPAAITLLFIFFSIPTMDRRNLERRPGYEEHIKKVSALVPWFPRK